MSIKLVFSSQVGRSYLQRSINALIIQNDCAIKFIWDMANSEQDPFKKTILQNLHRSIKAIGPQFKP